MENKTKSSEPVIKAPKSIAKSVSTTIMIMGITAELLSLILIVLDNKKNLISADSLRSMNMVILMTLILSMLIHHYFIINNFKRIDSSKVEDLKKIGFGNWVCKRNWEDYLRFPIFILFAVLTGEIQYIIAVGVEIYTQFTHSHSVFNLSWLTTIFVWASFALTCIMLVWNVAGLIYDCCYPIEVIKDENNEPAEEAINIKLVINPYPFKNAVVTFLISDCLAFLIWGCFLLMLNYQIWYVNDFLKYFAFFYIALILLRAVGPSIVQMINRINALKVPIIK